MDDIAFTAAVVSGGVVGRLEVGLRLAQPTRQQQPTLRSPEAVPAEAPPAVSDAAAAAPEAARPSHTCWSPTVVAASSATSGWKVAHHPPACASRIRPRPARSINSPTSTIAASKWYSAMCRTGRSTASRPRRNRGTRTPTRWISRTARTSCSPTRTCTAFRAPPVPKTYAVQVRNSDNIVFDNMHIFAQTRLPFRQRRARRRQRRGRPCQQLHAPGREQGDEEGRPSAAARGFREGRQTGETGFRLQQRHQSHR